MGYFVLPSGNEPLEIINNIEANLKLYLDKLPDEADYKYLLTTFVKSDLTKLREVLNDNNN